MFVARNLNKACHHRYRSAKLVVKTTTGTWRPSAPPCEDLPRAGVGYRCEDSLPATGLQAVIAHETSVSPCV